MKYIPRKFKDSAFFISSMNITFVLLKVDFQIFMRLKYWAFEFLQMFKSSNNICIKKKINICFWNKN